MNERHATVLVTIHGVGFQQPPLPDGTAGYADSFHECLSRHLGPDLLSDDPGRARTRPGQNGPIYVESHWPPGKLSTEPGLERLGSWTNDQHRMISTDGHPILGDKGTISHVALVYSNAQDLEDRPGSALDTAVRALVSLHAFATPAGAIRTGIMDVLAMMPGHAHAKESQTPSLRLREPVQAAQPSVPQPRATVSESKSPAQPSAPPSTPITIGRQLLNDVTTYICRDELRTRLRSFVHDAILRLCCREDVDSVVINAHSQGTVVAFDVIRELPPFALQKIQVFVTAGSPLRKYVDLFDWGDDGGCLWVVDGNSKVKPAWINFWDETDPVADPLSPPATWKRGEAVPAVTDGTSIFHGVDAETGTMKKIAIEDCKVDNVAHTPEGGLPAHNYWDNEPQVVEPLAEILRKLV